MCVYECVIVCIYMMVCMWVFCKHSCLFVKCVLNTCEGLCIFSNYADISLFKKDWTIKELI